MTRLRATLNTTQENDIDFEEGILAHIGMELNYVSGHPARVEMQKKAKAKAV